MAQTCSSVIQDFFSGTLKQLWPLMTHRALSNNQIRIARVTVHRLLAEHASREVIRKSRQLERQAVQRCRPDVKMSQSVIQADSVDQHRCVLT